MNWKTKIKKLKMKFQTKKGKIMKQLINIQQNENHGLVVSSRDLAETLGRQHQHIMRDLRNIISPNLDASQNNCDYSDLIFLNTYKDSMNRKQKEYLLTKDGFILYMFNIQGYNELKLAYINKFNEMEQYIKSHQEQQFYIPKTYAQALQLASKQAEQIEQLQLENKEMKPKADLYDEMVNDTEGMTLSQFSKYIVDKYELNPDNAPKKIYEWFRNSGYTSKSKFTYNQPRKKAIEHGLMVAKTIGLNTMKQPRKIAMITLEGIDFFESMLESFITSFLKGE